MTNKQLLKTLQRQQNRLLNIKGYSFYLGCSDNLTTDRYFIIYIHDGNQNQNLIFNEMFDIEDASLTIKLIKLRDLIDGLLNN